MSGPVSRQYLIRTEAQDTSEGRQVVEGWEGVLGYVLGLVPPELPFAFSVTEFDPAGAQEGELRSSVRKLYETPSEDPA